MMVNVGLHLHPRPADPATGCLFLHSDSSALHLSSTTQTNSPHLNASCLQVKFLGGETALDEEMWKKGALSSRNYSFVSFFS